MPDQIYAGRPFTLEFMVWQHGNKAVHNLTWDKDRTIPITPRVTLTSKESAESVTFAARPAKQKGLFAAEVTVPSYGNWEWSIAPDPLAGVTELGPLTVLPPPSITAEKVFQAPSVFLARAGFSARATLSIIPLLGILFLVQRSSRSQKTH